MFTDKKPIETGHFIHDGADFKKILLFIAEPLPGEIKLQADEVEKAEWVAISEAGKNFTDYYHDAWGEFLKRS